jgi:hypothetical protein
MSFYNQGKSHVWVVVALVLGAMSAAFTLEGCQMSKVVKKEQILLGEIGKPNFPEKAGAWRLGSEWKTKGRVASGVSRPALPLHEQDAQKQVPVTLMLYRSTDGARRALEKELAVGRRRQPPRGDQRVSVEALKLFGVSRQQAGVSGVYYLVSKAKHPGGLLGEPHSAFWVPREVVSVSLLWPG